MEPIAPPLNWDAIASEVDSLPRGQVLLEHGHEAVIMASAHQIPKVLCEIGRLREITFREAGEGTGRPWDIDRYDLYYLHLFLWDRDKKAIAGAYRLGPAGEMLSRFGPQGLYTSTLFRYQRGFFDHIRDGLEMGRSFVHPDYQKQYTSLLLLWRGIGRYVVRNPRYRKLFGPVTISNRYGPLSRQLMVAFLRLNHFAPEVASLVRPRTPLSRDRVCAAEALKMASAIRTIEELSSVIADIEPDGKELPVLLRQYLKLGGKLLGFNVDYSFAEALDGLILVDLMDTEERILERYMGVEESGAFLKFHKGELNESKRV